MWKLHLSLLSLIFAASAPAANMVPKAFGGFSPFGFNQFGATSSMLPPAPAAPASTATTNAQNAACLLNNCGSNAPGFSQTQLQTGANSLTGGVSNLGNAYSGGGFGQVGMFGFFPVAKFQVFGMYNVQGNTQQPAFSGGLGSNNILGTPGMAPEPGSIALFGAGLLALGWMRKRRLAA